MLVCTQRISWPKTCNYQFAASSVVGWWARQAHCTHRCQVFAPNYMKFVQNFHCSALLTFVVAALPFCCGELPALLSKQFTDIVAATAFVSNSYAPAPALLFCCSALLASENIQQMSQTNATDWVTSLGICVVC